VYRLIISDLLFHCPSPDRVGRKKKALTGSELTSQHFRPVRRIAGGLEVNPQPLNPEPVNGYSKSKDTKLCIIDHQLCTQKTENQEKSSLSKINTQSDYLQ